MSNAPSRTLGASTAHSPRRLAESAHAAPGSRARQEASAGRLALLRGMLPCYRGATNGTARCEHCCGMTSVHTPGASMDATEPLLEATGWGARCIYWM